MIKQHGEIDEIKVFIRSELKASRSGRKRQLMTRRKRNLTYEFHQKTVLEMGKNPTHTNVLKHRLWEEANRSCPYTGASHRHSRTIFRQSFYRAYPAVESIF